MEELTTSESLSLELGFQTAREENDDDCVDLDGTQLSRQTTIVAKTLSAASCRQRQSAGGDQQIADERFQQTTDHDEGRAARNDGR
jgi:hypothetical protein